MTTSTLATTHQSGQSRRHPMSVVDEADHYTSAVHGVTVETARVDRGIGPNQVLGIPGERLTVTSSRFGFPMTAGAHVPDDRILAAYVHENPAEGRWCGIPLRKGSVVIYSPGAEHLAINQVGLHFTFAITDPKHLMAHADQLGVPAELPHRPGLYEAHDSGASGRFGDELNRLTRVAVAGEPSERQWERVLDAFASLLASEQPATMHRPRRGLDSRAIVGNCIEYANSIGRVPSLGELCVAAHVSDRRLRSAFNEEFDVPPSQFFRIWALDLAHRRLRKLRPGEWSVAAVAYDLGLDHLGRFARSYCEVYGETPSATLASGG